MAVAVIGWRGGAVLFANQVALRRRAGLPRVLESERLPHVVAGGSVVAEEGFHGAIRARLERQALCCPAAQGLQVDLVLRRWLGFAPVVTGSERAVRARNEIGQAAQAFGAMGETEDGEQRLLGC